MGDNPSFVTDEEANVKTIPTGNSPTNILTSVSISCQTQCSKDKNANHSPVGQEPTNGKSDLTYGIEDTPPWYICAFMGLQQYLTMVGGTITIPFILMPLMCIENDDPIQGTILSTIFFTSGIVTLLQTTFGCRLPIVQGGTFSFIAPTIAILTSSAFIPCAQLDLGNMTQEDKTEAWQQRMREVQGAIMISSLFQIIVGFSGLMGLLLTWLTPLGIVPTVALVGLSLFDVAAAKAAQHWGIALMTMVLLILFSQYLNEVAVPIPTGFSQKKITCRKVQFFKLFPVLLAILMSWFVCFVLTVSGALSEDSPARTDSKTAIIQRAPWFYVPYPGQWGLPTVSVAGAFGMLAGVIASMVESVGDYYACARLSGAPPPPTHSINRGIGIEGIGCMIAGLLGTGNGTTSYSENIAAIKVTQVGSRRVIQAGALIMIILGIFGKFGALFITLPVPVVGGVFFVLFGVVYAVGISNLQRVKLDSSRNLFIMGFSIFFGLALSKQIAAGGNLVITGYEPVDQIFGVLLKTSMFVGGITGIFLDNTIPGTREERGLPPLTQDASPMEAKYVSAIYDLPFGMDLIRRHTWTKFVPFSPTFDPKFKILRVS